MKLKHYFILALGLASTTASAQKADRAQAIVHYKFTHVRDTTQRDKPYTENMMLLLGNQASAYKSYDKIAHNQAIERIIKDQVANNGGNVTIPAMSPVSNIEYYQFPAQKEFYTREHVGMNDYLIEERTPDMKWKISSDTATISGLACQKATTHFKGRNYIAWFCPDLPYRTGPWKLNGLPGLIVEAHDVKNEVVFKFDGLEKVNPDAAPAAPNDPSGKTIIINGDNAKGQDMSVIALPTQAIKVSTKEIADLKEIQRKDPQGFIKSQMAAMQSSVSASGGAGATFGGGGGGMVGVKSINVMGNPVNKSVTNNPIELPEK